MEQKCISLQYLRQSVDEFCLLGVRDKTTYDLLNVLELSNKDKLCLVPDPTFSYDIEHTHFETYSRRIGVNFDKPTIGIDLPDNLDICKTLVGYYKSKGFQVVSPRHNRYANYSLAMSPCEWAGMHRHLSLFITCHFHGIVFSLKNLTSVLVIDYDRGRYDQKGLSKTYCVLEQFGLNETNHINLERMNEQAS